MPRTTSDDLSPLPRDRLPDRVATAIKRMIVDGRYPPSSRLLAIRELAEQLRVTPPTVREALAQLESTGLIQSRHGSGTYVLDPSDHGTLNVLAETLAAGRRLTDDEVADLLAFRTVVVMGFIDAIAEQARPEHVDQLEAIVGEERARLGRHDQLAELDLRFNEVLATASGNLFYTLLLRSLREAHLRLGALVFRRAGDGAIVVDTHEAIVRALRKRDAAALRRRIKTYLTGGERLVTEFLRKA